MGSYLLVCILCAPLFVPLLFWTASLFYPSNNRSTLQFTQINPQVGFIGGYFGVYDTASLQRIAWHRRTTGGIEVVKYSPNGRRVATGSHENAIDLCDVKNKTSPCHHP